MAMGGEPPEPTLAEVTLTDPLAIETGNAR
jgi:hypothetical protein